MFRMLKFASVKGCIADIPASPVPKQSAGGRTGRWHWNALQMKWKMRVRNPVIDAKIIHVTLEIRSVILRAIAKSIKLSASERISPDPTEEFQKASPDHPMKTLISLLASRSTNIKYLPGLIISKYELRS